MKKEQKITISDFINGLIGIIAELLFISGILIIALIISYIATGIIK